MLEEVDLKCPKCGHIIRHIQAETTAKGLQFLCWCGGAFKAQPPRPMNSYWGWLPSLTHFFGIYEPGESYGSSSLNFEEATIEDVRYTLDYSFQHEENDSYFDNVILSDSYFDRLLRIKHKIELELISFKDGIIKFNFKIESPAIDTRRMHLKGSIDIWGTGIVKYEIYGDQSDEYAIAMVCIR